MPNELKSTIPDPSIEARDAILEWEQACKDARRKGKQLPVYPACPYPAGIQRDHWMVGVEWCKRCLTNPIRRLGQ